MTVPVSRHFDPARFFCPQRIALSGADTPLGQRVLAHLGKGGYVGEIGSSPAALPNADLGLLADAPENIEASLQAHARMGARGAIVLSRHVQGLTDMARAANIRVLGPNSYGLMLPGLGLNASPFGHMPPPGRMALIGQSSSIARIVIDWAVPNGMGFSQLIGIGGNSDIGFGLVLDHVSRDPGTAAIMLEIDALRKPHVFFAAARAAARLRPVVAIAPGMHTTQGGSIPSAVQAALARAGVLLTFTISEFLAAAETLTRVAPARTAGLAIITNSKAIGKLAADEVRHTGLSLAQLTSETRHVLALLDIAPDADGAIFAGKDPTRLADAAALLSSAPEIGGILVIHAPGEGDDDTGIEALVACAKTVKIPLLIAAMGEMQGQRHRHRLSQAQLACFDTPEAAVAGFRHLLGNTRNREAARELPDANVLLVQANKAEVAARIKAARERGQSQLVQDEALAVAAAYNIGCIATRHATTPDAAALQAAAIGFPVVLKLSHPSMPTNMLPGSVVLDLPDTQAVHDAARAILTRLAQRGGDAAAASFVVQAQAPHGTMLRVRVSDHPVLGPLIALGPGGGDPDHVADLTADLPPLNLALARALIARAPVAAALTAHRGQAAADTEDIAALLVRVSQLILDTPEILLLDFDPVFANAQGALAASGRLLLRPAGAARPPLIITPYPGALVTTFAAGGQKFTLRPIRPRMPQRMRPCWRPYPRPICATVSFRRRDTCPRRRSPACAMWIICVKWRSSRSPRMAAPAVWRGWCATTRMENPPNLPCWWRPRAKGWG